MTKSSSSSSTWITAVYNNTNCTNCHFNLGNKKSWLNFGFAEKRIKMKSCNDWPPEKTFETRLFLQFFLRHPVGRTLYSKWSGSEIVSYRESKSAPSPRRERLVYMCQNVTNNTGCFILIPFYSLRFVKTIPINHPLEKRTLSNEGVSRQRSNVIFVEIRTQIRIPKINHVD